MAAKAMKQLKPFGTIGAPLEYREVEKAHANEQQLGARVNDIRMAKDITPRGKNMGSTTQPELLLEAELLKSNKQYISQVELGYARLDGLVVNGDKVVALFADGDYWHKNEAGHDYGKQQLLIGDTVQGLTITHSVRMLESEIRDNPSYIIGEALEGRQATVLA